jgi:hypothetical protein
VSVTQLAGIVLAVKSRFRARCWHRTNDNVPAATRGIVGKSVRIARVNQSRDRFFIKS